MRRFEDLSTLPDDVRGQAVTIGNFDGVHRGHRMLIGRARNVAATGKKKLVLLTFEPHPRALFRPDDPPFRISPPSLKADLLENCGIDALVALPFNWDFASQSAEDFIRHVLIDGLAAHHVIVGADFCFGQLRKGTPGMINAAGIPVTTVAPEGTTQSEKFSSSDVRQHLRQGNIDAANAILGWEWEIRGTVVRGDRRGRALGYPTANVPLGDTLHPAYGIYACKVQIEGENEWHPAATNIGIRPMFEVKVGQVEAHILGGFNRDIYGKLLRIKPVKRLRGEAKFDSLDALIAQMNKDCAESLRILGT